MVLAPPPCFQLSLVSVLLKLLSSQSILPLLPLLLSWPRDSFLLLQAVKPLSLQLPLHNSQYFLGYEQTSHHPEDTIIQILMIMKKIKKSLLPISPLAGSLPAQYILWLYYFSHQECGNFVLFDNLLNKSTDSTNLAYIYLPSDCKVFIYNDFCNYMCIHTVIHSGVNISTVILSLENNEKQLETLNDWPLYIWRRKITWPFIIICSKCNFL